MRGRSLWSGRRRQVTLILLAVLFDVPCGGQAFGSAENEKPGSTVPIPARAQISVVPDDFHQPQDGDDDAPSINRAIAELRRTGQTDLKFLGRSYLLKSAVLQNDWPIQWDGRGWSELRDGGQIAPVKAPGTWLVVAATGFNPVTISGLGSRGTRVENLGVIELQEKPVSGKPWKPIDYPYVFSVDKTYGTVDFNHLMFWGVSRGISSYLSGRLNIQDLSGQFFDTAIQVDKSYDANTYRDIHIWPFWSQSDPVMDYIQSHLDVIWLERADTGVIDNLFVFGSRSAIRLGSSATEAPTIVGGSPTKNTIQAIHCDSTRWCIWITGTGVHFQVDSLDEQGQKWSTSGAAPVALNGVASIRIEGQAVIQIGRIWQEFTDHSTLSFLNTKLASNVQIGSLYEDFTYADKHPAHVVMKTTATGPQTLFVAAPAMVVTRRDQAMSDGASGTNGNSVIH